MITTLVQGFLASVSLMRLAIANANAKPAGQEATVSVKLNSDVSLFISYFYDLYAGTGISCLLFR